MTLLACVPRQLSDLLTLR
jgi:hypothetical protein